MAFVRKLSHDSHAVPVRQPISKLILLNIPPFYVLKSRSLPFGFFKPREVCTPAIYHALEAFKFHYKARTIILVI